MQKIEKMGMTILVLATLLSAALFGIREDKVLLEAPLLVLVYLAVAGGEGTAMGFRPWA